MRKLLDTIVAPISGPGPAAVTVIRLSGHDSWAIASTLFKPWNPDHAVASFGRATTNDEGYALPFQGPKSFTGEDTVEFMLHGSPGGIQIFLDACCQSGARLAEHGEFTQRAFLNGKLDLTQAEGVLHTIEAQTAVQFRLATSLRAGRLKTTVLALTREITAILAAVEASVDFPEEVGPLDRDKSQASLRSVGTQLDHLILAAKSGHIIRSGARVVLAGPPNVGKSSLFNALLETNRAIVTPVPGTTRDTLEEELDIEGYRVVLVDTAGLRQTTDEVEELGIARTRDAVDSANIVLRVYEAGGTPDQKPLTNEILVANKADLTMSSEGLLVSAMTGKGLDDLQKAIFSKLRALAPEVDVVPNNRHAGHLQAAKASIEEAIEFLDTDWPADLLVVHLRSALHELGQITGEAATDDLLDRLFADFCIGK